MSARRRTEPIFVEKYRKNKRRAAPPCGKDLFHMETIVSRQPSAAGRLTAHLYRHRWLYLLAALLFGVAEAIRMAQMRYMNEQNHR